MQKYSLAIWDFRTDPFCRYVETPALEEAKQLAKQEAQKAIRSHAGYVFQDHHWSLTVTDEAGAEVFRLRLDLSATEIRY